MTTFAYRTQRWQHIARLVKSLIAAIGLAYFIATDTAFTLARRRPHRHLTDASAAALWASRIGWLVLLAPCLAVLAASIVSLLNRSRNTITVTDDAIVIPRHEWSHQTLTIHRDEVRFIERSRPRLDGGFQRCDLSFGTETKRLSCQMFESGREFDAFVDQIAKVTGVPITTDLGL